VRYHSITVWLSMQRMLQFILLICGQVAKWVRGAGSTLYQRSKSDLCVAW
jgi:hypothetical protein